METKRKIPFTSYHIPMDVLMDILRIALQADLDHRIEGINDKQNTIIMRLYFPQHTQFSRQVKENIESILAEYGYYMNGSPNRNWDDDFE